MGPYPISRSGNRYFLVATDLYSKWVEVKAVKDIKTRTAIEFLQDVCSRWGYPQRVITDNGANFRTDMWTRYLNQHGIEGYYTPIYYQRANPVERRNQEIKKLLRIHLQGKPPDRWDEQIKDVLFALRNRANAATGIAPSEALLGAQLPAPGEWQHPTVQQPVQNRQADREERRVRAKQEVYTRRLYPGGDPPAAFRVGDRVLVRSFEGMRPIFGAPWLGPFPIVAVKGNDVYEVDRNGSQMPIHVDDIRPAPRQRVQLEEGEHIIGPCNDRFLERFQRRGGAFAREDEEVVNDDHRVGGNDGDVQRGDEVSEAEGEGEPVSRLGDRVPERAQVSSPPAPWDDRQPSTSKQSDEQVELQQIVNQRTIRYYPSLPTIENCESEEEEAPPKRDDAVPVIGLYP